MKITPILIPAIFALSGLVYAHNEQNVSKHDQAALGWLIVVNESEINAANDVDKRHVKDDIKDYAKMMIDEHSKNLEKTNELSKDNHIQALKDVKTKSLENKNKAALKKLKAMKDEKFEKEYVDAMVKDHDAALKDLDKVYMPKVQNEEVKKHLSDTRDHIVKHLEKAKELKDKMKD